MPVCTSIQVILFSWSFFGGEHFIHMTIYTDGILVVIHKIEPSRDPIGPGATAALLRQLPSKCMYIWTSVYREPSAVCLSA
jgi:hypothetical protein